MPTMPTIKQIIENSKKKKFLKKIETDPILRETKAVAEVVLAGMLEEKLTEVDDSIQEKFAEVNKEIQEWKQTIKKGDKPVVGVDFPFPKDGDNYVLTEIDKQEIASKIEIPIVERVIEKTEVVKEQPIITNEIKEVAKSDTPLEIADKLNTLEEKVEKKVIKGLENELLNIKRQIKQAKSGKQVHGGGGRNVKSYDLSPLLDGVTKTFTIPSNQYMIDVKIGHPSPLRETIDYTWTQTTITFTDQIDASVYLQNGASVIIIYAE